MTGHKVNQEPTRERDTACEKERNRLLGVLAPRTLHGCIEPYRECQDHHTCLEPHILKEGQSSSSGEPGHRTKRGAMECAEPAGDRTCDIGPS